MKICLRWQENVPDYPISWLDAKSNFSKEVKKYRKLQRLNYITQMFTSYILKSRVSSPAPAEEAEEISSPFYVVGIKKIFSKYAECFWLFLGWSTNSFFTLNDNIARPTSSDRLGLLQSYKYASL